MRFQVPASGYHEEERTMKTFFTLLVAAAFACVSGLAGAQGAAPGSAPAQADSAKPEAKTDAPKTKTKKAKPAKKTRRAR
jgi:hypothetical protein